MAKLKYFIVKKSKYRKDPNLGKDSRGGRKLLVTKIYKEKETAAKTHIWEPPRKTEKCEVLKMRDTEVAIFNNFASQDRHYHKLGTEIYIVIEGKMSIEIEDKVYTLQASDMVVVLPYSKHQVLNERSEFISRVICVNCLGSKDKYLA